MIVILGRKIKILTGRNSQTVNICTAENNMGVYEYIIRLKPPFITEQALLSKGFRDFDSLAGFLVTEHGGRVEKAPDTSIHASREVISPVSSHPVPVKRTQWEGTAVEIIEDCIDRLVLMFIEEPFLHRTEHSIHCELFRLITENEMFRSHYPMGRWKSQTVHKEWPEFTPRPEKGNRRGNFDICIISPDTLANANQNDFCEGRLRPSIVIEMGLNYAYRHLESDERKLINSGISDSYLIHLTRPGFTDDFDAVENLLVNSKVRSAYGNVTWEGARYKLIPDAVIQTG